MPLKTPAKSILTNFRLEPELKEKLERLATAWSMSVSGTVRRLIIEAKIPKESE